MWKCAIVNELIIDRINLMHLINTMVYIYYLEIKLFHWAIVSYNIATVLSCHSVSVFILTCPT